MDLAAYVLPVVGCFLFLDYKIGKDAQPKQVWVLSFSILALYMNIVSGSICIGVLLRTTFSGMATYYFYV